MGSPLRKWFDSIVYVGLNRPSDPLYLSNRSLGDRVRLGILLALPVLVVGGVLLAAWLRGNPPAPEAVPAGKPARPVASEAAVAPRPPLGVEVLEAHVDRSGRAPKVVATVRNTSPGSTPALDVVFGLLDRHGSQVGAVSAHLQNMAAAELRVVTVPVDEPRAAAVVVKAIQAP